MVLRSCIYYGYVSTGISGVNSGNLHAIMCDYGTWGELLERLLLLLECFQMGHFPYVG